MGTAAVIETEPTPEAVLLQEKESRELCVAALQARQAMPEEDQRKMEDLAAKLRPYLLCNLCKNLLLEPWLIKDCGHLYCFRCLHSIVYEHQVRGPGAHLSSAKLEIEQCANALRICRRKVVQLVDPDAV
jgi:hypothetical protein